MCESGRASYTVVVLGVQSACARLKTLFKPLWRALVPRQYYIIPIVSTELLLLKRIFWQRGRPFKTNCVFSNEDYAKKKKH